MSGGGGGEKSEKPTAKRLKEARKEGQVARSPDITAWVGILLMAVLAPSTLERTYDAVGGLIVALPSVTRDPDPGRALALLGDGLAGAAMAVAPVLAVLVVVAVAGGVAQGGAKPVMARLKPKAKRMNPVNGLKRAFGPAGVWEMVKALLKTVVVAVMVWRAAQQVVPLLMGSGALPLGSTLATAGSAAVGMVRDVAAVALAVAAADYLVSWRRIRKQVRMTRKEVEDENRQSEGDPHVKASLRQRAMAMSRNRMMADVAAADVVVVNPTHVAVALAYSPGKGAPRVVAKGAGVVAAKIRAVAAEHRVPLVEDVPLARTLYAACKVGQAIPAELYTAVARILAFVMGLRRRGSAAGFHSADALARAEAGAARARARAA